MRVSAPRRVLVGLALASTAFAVTGCSAHTTATPHHQTVTISGTITSTEATQLEAAWKPWAVVNDLTINYISNSTERSGVKKADIGLFSAPGELAASVSGGAVVQADPATAKNVAANFSTDWQRTVSSGGHIFGTPLDASLDGYIWYSPTRFAAWGIKPPHSLDALLAATKTITAKTGQPPWCAGFNAGADSGWPGADQLAETVLATSGPHTYDDWVAGKIPFTDQRINTAFSTLAPFLVDPQHLNAGYGSVPSINQTPPADTATKLTSGRCALTNQPLSFETTIAATTLPTGTKPTINPHGDIWAIPLPTPSGAITTVIGSGESAAAFNNNPGTRKVMDYLSSTAFANSLLALPSAHFITPNKHATAAKGHDPLQVAAAQTLQNRQTTFRLNPDNTLPNTVETAIRSGMINWINGTPQNAVEQQIQTSRHTH